MAILDEGEIKSIDHYKMNKKDSFKELDRRYELEYFGAPEEVQCKMVGPWDMRKADLYAYYKIRPFNPHWMLNISPAWKGQSCEQRNKNGVATAKRVKFISEVMELFYDDARRFSRVKYVIEGGKEADFLHVHAVFELNAKKPNNILHMKKGNFLKSFRTIWNRHASEVCPEWEGLVGSKHALQTTYITSEEMLQDKLDYLVEDLKPISHKNSPGFKSIQKSIDWD